MDKNKSSEKMTSLDFILLSMIILIYSLFALHDLGKTSSPQTIYHMVPEEYIMLDFGDSYPVKASFFMGPGSDWNFFIYSYDYDAESWCIGSELQVPYCFTWTDTEFQPLSSQILIELSSTETDLFELAFFDENGNRVLPKNANEYSTLFDEQNLYNGNADFRSSMYFDEIYHARTAYEMIHNIPIYENTHPPLGKWLISLGIRIFGMTPFGWRFVGTFFGILMLPIFYLFIKELMEDTALASLGTFLFAFDFMHFVQTRIATIDVYVTFFILLMYYFMYRYLKVISDPDHFKALTQKPSKSKKNVEPKKLSLRSEFLPLCLCGICMGFGIASKWTGVYAGVGLGLLFFVTWFNIIRKSKNKYVLKQRFYHTCGFCLIFFVLLPAIIYTLSYIPVNDGTSNGLFKRMWDNQISMLNYHKYLDATHPFGSPFYQWPIMIKPVWYYSNVLEGNFREGISSFGNPLIWWIGIPITVFLIIYAFKKKDRKAAFLLVGYFAQYLPWFFITRVTFIYHYFPSVVFVVLMITYCFSLLREKLKPKPYYVMMILYAALVFGMFVFFYPILSGQSIDAVYVDKYLEWMDSWYFVAEVY